MYKRRFHDLGAEPSGGICIAKEPERTKLPKRTVLGIIQNQRGTSADQSKDRQNTEAEKIKVSHRPLSLVHFALVPQFSLLHPGGFSTSHKYRNSPQTQVPPFLTSISHVPPPHRNWAHL